MPDRDGEDPKNEKSEDIKDENPQDNIEEDFFSSPPKDSNEESDPDDFSDLDWKSGEIDSTVENENDLEPEQTINLKDTRPGESGMETVRDSSDEKEDTGPGQVQPESLEAPDEAREEAGASIKPDGGAEDLPAELAVTDKESDEWVRLVQIFEREAAAANTKRRRAELYFEMGRLWEQRLGALKQAMDSYEKSCSADQTYLPPLNAARRLLMDSRQWEKAATFLKREIEHANDDASKSLLLLDYSEILSEHLNKPDEAADALSEAVSLDPKNMMALYRMKQQAKASGNGEKWAEAAMGIAEAASEPSLKAFHLFEAASLLIQAPEKKEAALELYRQSLLIDPTNANTVRALRKLLAELGRFEDLLTLFNTEIRLAEDNREKALLLYQSARICTEHLENPDKAIQLLKQASDLAPDNLLVLNELEKVCDVNQMWQDLADVYNKLADATTDVHNKVSLYYKLGLLWEEKLFDDQKAIEAFSKIREVFPSYLPALQSLGKLYAKNKNWENQIDMLLLEAEATKEKRQIANRYFKAAEIFEEKLANDDKAIEMYSKVLELIPNHLPSLKALGSYYNKYKRWEDLAVLYLGELNVTHDKAQKTHLLEKLGNLYEERLGQREKAIETYRRILQEVPDYLPAVRLLGRIFFQQGQWEDLLDVNEQEANIVQDPNQIVALYHKNGEIFEEKLEDKDKAAEYYRRALAIQPTYLPALSDLGRLYLQRGNWEDLINMYYQEIEVTQSPEVVVSLQYKIGEIWEEKLLNEENAIDSYMKVLDLEPTYIPALEALARIYTSRRDWNNLVETYERQIEITKDDNQRIFLLFKIGEIFEERLDDPEKAVEAYRQALDANSGYLPAIRSLIRLYVKTGQWSELITVYEAELAGTTSANRKVTLLQVMAEIHDQKLSNPDAALYCYEQILEIDQSNLVALRILEETYRSKGQWEKLYLVLSRLAELVGDRDSQVALQLEMAKLVENKLQDKAAPGDHYLKVLEIDPFNKMALDALEDLYKKAGVWEGLAETLERKKKSAQDPTERCVLAHQLGDLWDKNTEDKEKAAAYYAEALENDPTYLPSIKALKRMLTRLKRWQDLLTILKKEAEAAQSPYQAVATQFQIGFISLNKLADPEKAKQGFLKVLELDPLHGESFRLLDALLAQQGEYQELLELYETRIRNEQQPRELAALYDKAARLCLERLDDVDKAQDYLAKALEQDSDNKQALYTLCDLKISFEKWSEAKDLLKRLIQLGGSREELIALNFKQGTLLEEKLSDSTGAMEYFKAVLAFDPDNVAALEKLGGLYLQVQDWRNALETINKLITKETSRKRLVDHYLKLAIAYKEGFNDTANAEICYQRALEVDPASLDAVKNIVEMYKAQNRIQEAASAYDNFLSTAPIEVRQEAIELFDELGDLYINQLNDMDKAIGLYRRAVNDIPSNTHLKITLANLMAATPVGKQEAIETYKEIVARDPLQYEAFHALGRLYRELGETDKAYLVTSFIRYLKDANDEEMDFISENRAKIPKEPAAKLTKEDHESIITHKDERGLLRNVASIIGEGLTRLYPENPLKTLGLGRSNRLSTRSNANLRKILDDFASQLGLPGYDAYIHTNSDKPIKAFIGAPPILIISSELERQTRPVQKFHLAWAIELLVNRGALFTKIGADATRKVFAAVVHNFEPDFPLPGIDQAELDEISKKLYKGLPRKSRKVLEPMIKTLAHRIGELDFESYVQALTTTADRAGFVLCGDLGVAVSALLQDEETDGQIRISDSVNMLSPLAKSKRIAKLLEFALSDQYFLVRKNLGMSLE
ncbi:MAG: tetratricopeptide repeat protein [Deltaproteobacteria bacterium]|nr:tetratricopeptide repeat protein [Deltaproteobacteria bacterium]